MQNKVEVLNEDYCDDVLDFSLLPDCITTVNIIIEHIELTETDKYGDTESYYDFSKETVAAVKKLDPIHSYEDHLFDTKKNVVVDREDVKKLYDISYLI